MKKLKILLSLSLILCLLAAPASAAAEKGGSTPITATVPSSHQVSVYYNRGGGVKKDNADVDSGTALEIPRHQDVVFTLEPKTDYKILSVFYQGNDVTHQVKNNRLSLPKISDDGTLQVSYIPSDVSQDENYRFVVRGRIVRNGEPLANTDIELHSEVQQTRTDDNGQFVFNSVPEGAHELFAMENGQVIGTADFRIDRTGNLDGVEMDTLPDGTIQLVTNIHIKTIELNLILREEDSRLEIESADTPKGNLIYKTVDKDGAALSVEDCGIKAATDGRELKEGDTVYPGMTLEIAASGNIAEKAYVPYATAVSENTAELVSKPTAVKREYKTRYTVTEEDLADGQCAIVSNYVLLGDVNFDEVIDAQDAGKLKRIILETDVRTEVEAVAINVNFDDQIDAQDAGKLKRYILETDTQF